MAEVRSELSDGILTLTLADVENRNALGAAVINGLHDAVEQANADAAIRALVVTNDGNTFCAGANLKQQSGAAAGERPKVGLDGLLHGDPALAHARRRQASAATWWGAATAWRPPSTSRSPPTT